MAKLALSVTSTSLDYPPIFLIPEWGIGRTANLVSASSHFQEAESEVFAFGGTIHQPLVSREFNILGYTDNPDAPFSRGTASLNRTTNIKPPALSQLQQLLVTPLTETMKSLLEKDEVFAIKLAALVEELHNRLPKRPIELAYEPGDDVADWILYIYLREEGLHEDLAKLDWVYEEYLPKQDTDFNKKIVLVPL